MVDPLVAVVDSVAVMHPRRRRVGPMADVPLAAVALGHITAVAVARITVVGLGRITAAVARITAAGDTTVAGGITVVGDITDQVLASVSASTRLMGMRLRSAIRPDSMTQMAYGNTIPAAPCRTDISRPSR